MLDIEGQWKESRKAFRDALPEARYLMLPDNGAGWSPGPWHTL